MTLSRRNIIELSVAGAAAMTAGSRIAGAASQDGVDNVRDSALAYFTDHGYAELPPLDMITGDPFNGGLRYDETRPEPRPFSWFAIQPAARIEDIAERDRFGVLAGFTMVGLSHAAPTETGELFGSVLDFLVTERHLDPERMVFVSTELVRPYLDRFATVHADRFMKRDLAEAMAARDGSGYFAPPGHPQAPEFLSVGIYYPMEATTVSADISYPPDNHIEIADVSVLSGDGRPNAIEQAGIGLERVAMAAGNPVPDFDETRLNLLRIIEDEARREGKDLPPGYTKFASL